MHFTTLYFENLWQLFNAISIYLIFGLIFASILKHIIPEYFIKKQLGAHSGSSIIKAALIGIPFPLCSCSVIPFAAALKRSGASNPALQTFFISTPITGADSILATYGTMGGIFTIFRVISSIFISLVAGFLTLFFTHTTSPIFSIQKPENFSLILKESQKKIQKKSSILSIYDYAFTTLLKDIAKPLIVGTFIAALITTFIPEGLPHFFQNSLFLNYIAVLLLAVPIYVCATASIPLAISLILVGFSPGSALIFLTAGPGTSIITIPIIKKLLGKDGLIIYLVSIVAGSLICGFLLDMIFQDTITKAIHATHLHENTTIFHVISTFILLFFCLKIFKDQYLKKGSCCG